MPSYPSLSSWVWSFDWSATFFVSFCPSGAAAKSIVVTVVVTVVDVLVVFDVVVVDAVPLPAPVFLAEDPAFAGACDVCDVGPVAFVDGPDVGPWFGPAFAGGLGWLGVACADGPWVPEFPRWPATAGTSIRWTSAATPIPTTSGYSRNCTHPQLRYWQRACRRQI